MLHLCKRPVHGPNTEMIEREKSLTPNRLRTHEYFFKACPDQDREANLEHMVLFIFPLNAAPLSTQLQRHPTYDLLIIMHAVIQNRNSTAELCRIVLN